MNAKKRVPELRFGEFSGEWEEKKLNKLTKVYDGTHSTPKYVEKGIPFFSVEHITANQFENTKYIAKDIFDKENKRVKLEKNDILMTRIGDIGTSKLINWDVNASFYVTLALIKQNEKFYSSFIDQQIKSQRFQKQLFKRTLHVAFPKKINLGEIGECSLYLTTKPEQEKIASFLSSVDSKIEQLSKKKTLLEQYKKGVMQKIFSQELRFKEDDGNEFPEWVERKLGEVVEFANGKGHEQSIDENGQFIVVNSKFISSNGNVKKYTNNLISPISKDSIVMVMSDVPKGKALAKCFYVESNNLYSLNQRICSLKSRNYDNKYLFYILNRNSYFLQFDSGVGQTNLRKDEVLDCPIIIPTSKLEQTKIANFLSSLDKKIELTTKELNATKEFKKGLLQKMFV